MRSSLLVLIVSICGCSSLVCEFNVCLEERKELAVTRSEVAFAGGSAGQWLSFKGGPSDTLFVLSSASAVEIQAVRGDGLFFDIAQAQDREPTIGVRPEALVPSILLPPNDVELLIVGLAQTLVMVRASRVTQGTTLPLDWWCMDETECDTYEEDIVQAIALLGFVPELHRVEPSDVQLSQATTATLSEFAAFGTSARLQLFFVREIEGGAAGRSSGSPAAPIVGKNAVLIAKQDPKLIAHELGHALGLLHLIERDGTRLEALSDTALCEDDDNNGVFELSECIEASSNLMFWGGAGTELSSEQRARMRKSPFLR